MMPVTGPVWGGAEHVARSSRRLLLATPATTAGGAEEYVVAVGCEAVSRGWDVHVLLHDAAPLDSVAGRLAAAGCTLHRRPIGRDADRLATLPRHFAAADGLIQLLRPHALHLTLPWPDLGLPLLLAAAIHRVPTICVFQNVEAPRFSPVRRALQHWCRRRHQRWVAVSNANRDVLCTALDMPAVDMSVIWNGVDEHAPQAAAEIERLPQGALTIMTVGRLHSQKGYDRIAAAIPAILAARPDAHFVWVGDGPERERLEHTIARNDLADRVHLLGWRDDVASLLQRATLFLLPSRFEGLPFAVVEALAAGVPVVATAVGGVPETVRHGVDGLICEPHPSSIAQSVISLLNDEPRRRTMALAARERALLFSRRRMLDDTMAALSEVASARVGAT